MVCRRYLSGVNAVPRGRRLVTRVLGNVDLLVGSCTRIVTQEKGAAYDHCAGVSEAFPTVVPSNTADRGAFCWIFSTIYRAKAYTRNH